MPKKFESTSLMLKNENQAIEINLTNSITNVINWCFDKHPVISTLVLLIILGFQWLNPKNNWI